MLVVWGERYRRYFTDYCLPSLLAPNNIPALVNKADSKFAIATTAEDWAELNKLDVFKALREHIEPVLMELPPFSAEDPKMLVMSSGHKRLSNYAFERKSFGVNINPDSIYSDFTVRALQESARRGVKMVLYPGVRFEYESVVNELRRRGYLGDPTAIAIPPRVAAGIGIRNPHPFTIACWWDNDCFFDFPVYHYIVTPKRDTMVAHTISMGPIMLDYSAIESHDDSIFEEWTLDGDYAHSNFGHFDIDKEIEYVDDSDTFMVLGFTPKDEDNIHPPRIRGPRFFRNLRKGLHLWRVYTDPVVDPLKKRLYLRQVVFHEGELDEKGRQLVLRDSRIVNRRVMIGITDKDVLAYERRHRKFGREIRPGEVGAFRKHDSVFYRIGLPALDKISVAALRWIDRGIFKVSTFLLWYYHRGLRLVQLTKSYLIVIWRAMLLDRTEIDRISRRIRKVANWVLRRRQV